MISSDDDYSGDNGRWPVRCLLASVPPPDRPGLLRIGVLRRYDRGDILMRDGEAGQDAFLITDGCVKVLGDNAEGNPALLAVRMTGDLVGELSVLDGKPRSSTVQAASPTRTRVIPGRDLLAFLSTHPATAAAVHNNVTAKLREAIRDRIDLNGAPVALRLARVILKLGTAYGTEVPEGVLIGAPLSQADFGSLVGTTEQSIRRALGTLRDEGLVLSHYRKLIVTDMNRLREMAHGRAPASRDRRIR